ncbi:hypothetical protein [Cytobacillus sp. IB215316]|uniref:hypothetical protein n=1 Tax=Cytobacillus sp. IB215316 TaxID=3097354 RepID=UPI002A0C6BDC|nr:hypothetical protein [Cytobacillus sp. IB215316]MDX8362457.1 hypothetical protein [Cytobacillus sp. IB215316]
MSQYKKVSTCCGSTFKEGKTSDCPCQLLADVISAQNNGLNSTNNNIAEVYNGRAIGIRGKAELKDGITNPNGMGEVVINFTSNGIIQPITLKLNGVGSISSKIFSFLNVAKIEVIVMSGVDLNVLVSLDGMTELCS